MLSVKKNNKKFPPIDKYLICCYTSSMTFTPEQLEVRRARARQWIKDHPERAAATRKAYAEKNRDILRARCRAYTYEHPVENRERVQRWRVSHPWYDSWQAARQRCTNPNHPGWKYYGGRGIKFALTRDEVAALWARDKAAVMKNPSIDRKDNDGDYSLVNCRFVEKSLNSQKSLVERRYPGIAFYCGE